MKKHLFAIAFSAAVFLKLPPVDLSRGQAWGVIMSLYIWGIALGCVAQEIQERWRKRK